jgi:hypothetical protein
VNRRPGSSILRVALAFGLASVCLASVSLAWAQPAFSDTSSPGFVAQRSTLVFHFERAGLPVAVYTFTLNSDGTGTYSASYSGPVASFRYGPDASTSIPPTDETRAVVVSPRIVSRLFERVRSTNHFQTPCASPLKNIADTGIKTLTYTGSDGTAGCTYNFTENKAVLGITNDFQAMALMLDEGRTLEHLHRFDRLGLDREMTILVNAVQDGTALEPGIIASTLRSLAEDQQVMERVRARAARLLELNAIPKSNP